MIGIDLFSGAGGMSLGARMAGVDVQIAVEADPSAAATYYHNHSDVNLFSDDIRKFRKINIQKNRLLVVFGGPPCQGFSTSNQRTRTIDNPNNWLFEEFLRVVKLYSPDWVVFENVQGIVETEEGLFVDKIMKRFHNLGYTTAYKVLNAADYGVPQKRSRFFLVASKHGIEFKFPEKKIDQPVTVKEALYDLPKLGNGWYGDVMPYRCKPKSEYSRQMRKRLHKSTNHLVTRNSPIVLERYKYVPQGGNWEDIPNRLMKNYTDLSRCHTGIYHRLEFDKPSVVLGNYRKNMLVHPTEHRGLSVREAARLQSFPDWFEFKGSIGFQQQQVGNAVPPLMAKAVFLNILYCK
jgi:DNA (cytosine-5)-methyltransferase 1